MKQINWKGKAKIQQKLVRTAKSMLLMLSMLEGIYFYDKSSSIVEQKET